MKTVMNQSINVGVDAGKHQLDIYLRPLNIYFTVANDEKGIKEAINRIKNTTLRVRLLVVLKCPLLWLVPKQTYRLLLPVI